MRYRCNNPNANGFHLYGGRGITVCARWDDFWTFVADMGERPPGTTLDRIDVNGNYEPGNCRWATPKEQGRNRRNNEWVTIEGAEYKLVDLAELSGRNKQTIRQRIKAGRPYAEVIYSGEHPRGGPKILEAGQISRERRLAATHCRNGHEYTPDNTAITADGYRRCRQCTQDAMRRHIARRVSTLFSSGRTVPLSA